MSRISYIFVILVSLNGWCAAKLQMKVDLSSLPDITPITELREYTVFKNINY